MIVILRFTNHPQYYRQTEVAELLALVSATPFTFDLGANSLQLFGRLHHSSHPGSRPQVYSSSTVFWTPVHRSLSLVVESLESSDYHWLHSSTPTS